MQRGKQSEGETENAEGEGGVEGVHCQILYLQILPSSRPIKHTTKGSALSARFWCDTYSRRCYQSIGLLSLVL